MLEHEGHGAVVPYRMFVIVLYLVVSNRVIVSCRIYRIMSSCLSCRIVSYRFALSFRFLSCHRTGLEIGKKNQSHLRSGDDVRVQSGHNFANCHGRSCRKSCYCWSQYPALSYRVLSCRISHHVVSFHFVPCRVVYRIMYRFVLHRHTVSCRIVYCFVLYRSASFVF